MKPEETIFDGISDSEMESGSRNPAGGLLKYSLNLKENQPQVMVIIKCCNNKGKQEQQKTVDPTT